MDATAAERLIQPEPAQPGWLVRTLGTVVPGVRRTGEQIEVFAAEWHERNLAALDSGKPLLVSLGDSLAQGIGASSIDHGYVGRLAAEFANEVAVVNLSRSGAKIPDVLDRQLRILSDLGIEPAIVTCTVGSNDLLRGGSLATPAQNMRRLIAALPATTIMATLPDQGSLSARRLSGVVRTEVPAHGLALADVSTEIDGWRGRTAPDGFHPNDVGYDTWVRAFGPVIESMLG